MQKQICIIPVGLHRTITVFTIKKKKSNREWWQEGVENEMWSTKT